MDDPTGELHFLRWHWGEAYEINYICGQFHAKRRDNGAMVHAVTADDMLRAIYDDYSARPVPRDVNDASY